MEEKPDFVFWSVIVGLLVTPLFLWLALVSAGGGHGNYGAARVLFPYSMLLTRLTGSITLPLGILAVLQFPMYGMVFGLYMSDRKGKRLFAVAMVAHVICVCTAFSRLLSDFS